MPEKPGKNRRVESLLISLQTVQTETASEDAVSVCGEVAYFFRHSLMNFLRSSPFSSFFPASALQDFIFSCCAS